MGIEFIKVSGSSANLRSALSMIFVKGWYDVLKMLCKDKAKLQRAFEYFMYMKRVFPGK